MLKSRYCGQTAAITTTTTTRNVLSHIVWTLLFMIIENKTIKKNTGFFLCDTQGTLRLTIIICQTCTFLVCLQPFVFLALPLILETQNDQETPVHE